MLKTQTPRVMSGSCAENLRHILQDNVTQPGSMTDCLCVKHGDKARDFLHKIRPTCTGSPIPMLRYSDSLFFFLFFVCNIVL